MQNNFNLLETAKKIRMSLSWVSNKVKEKKINVVRLGGKIFVTEQEIERILREGVAK